MQAIMVPNTHFRPAIIFNYLPSDHITFYWQHPTSQRANKYITFTSYTICGAFKIHINPAQAIFCSEDNIETGRYSSLLFKIVVQLLIKHNDAKNRIFIKLDIFK